MYIHKHAFLIGVCATVFGLSVSQAATITVTKATYGERKTPVYVTQCKPNTIDLTQQTANQCNGKTICTFQVPYPKDDPSFGCYKSYSVTYNCGGSSTTADIGGVHNEAALQTLQMQCTDEGMEILAATYGPNCQNVQTGNRTTEMASACDGKANCSYNPLTDGDPAVGCPKQFAYTYSCVGYSQPRTVVYPNISSTSQTVMATCSDNDRFRINASNPQALEISGDFSIPSGANVSVLFPGSNGQSISVSPTSTAAGQVFVNIPYSSGSNSLGTGTIKIMNGTTTIFETPGKIIGVMDPAGCTAAGFSNYSSGGSAKMCYPPSTYKLGNTDLLVVGMWFFTSHPAKAAGTQFMIPTNAVVSVVKTADYSGQFVLTRSNQASTVDSLLNYGDLALQGTFHNRGNFTNEAEINVLSGGVFRNPEEGKLVNNGATINNKGTICGPGQWQGTIPTDGTAKTAACPN